MDRDTTPAPAPAAPSGKGAKPEPAEKQAGYSFEDWAAI